MRINWFYKWFCITLAGQMILLSAAWAQNDYTANLPQIIPMSPQAAQFIRYGEIPVGHTTGVPQISIPIYTLSTNWIDIPISISYHASGFRSKEIPSPVGLGWILNAGGIISRSIEMSPDYKGDDPSYNWDAENQIKSASDVESLKNGTKTVGTLNFHEYGNWDDWGPFFFPSLRYPLFDTRSDRYYYSYLGNNGVARYNVDTKALTPIPYEPIKIEKTSNGFLITDTKGITYEFTQTESSFVNGKGSAVSGWYLTKITSPGKENEPIIFSYQNGTSYSDYNGSYNQFTSIIDTRNTQIMSGVPTIGMPESGSQTSTNSVITSFSSPLLATITWKNVTIAFTYAADRQDQRKDRITSITVNYGGNTIKQAIFNNNVYFGNSAANYRLKLSGILIKGSNTTNEGDQYTFNYYNENATIPNYEHECHEDYWGYYNGTSSDWSFPSDINVDQATGNLFVGANFYHSVPSTNRKPDEYSTKTCVLKEIIYPTKGKSVFDYELNEVPNAYQFMSSYNKVGGLRLKQRTNYSDANTISDIKSYIYEGHPTQVLTNDLFVYRMQYIDSYYYMTDIYQGTYSPVKIEYPGYHFTGMPMTSLSGWTGSNVFYTKVKEYNGTAPNTSEGWVEYNYEEENRTLNNTCSFNVGDYPPYMFSKYVDCDKGNIKELLKSVISYNKTGDIVKKVENQYQLFSIPSIHTGVRVFQNAIYPSGPTLNSAGLKTFQDRLDFYNSGNVPALQQAEYENFYLNWIYAMDTYAFCDVSLPGSTTETDYVNGVPAISKVTSYSYDTKDGKPVLFTPSSVTTQNSKGETFTKKISFPYSDAYKNSAPYNTMVSKNILSPTIERSEYKNTQFLTKEVTEYKDWGNGLFAPQFIKLQGTSQSALETRITYYNYDQSGNPLYLSKDNADKIVYLWGYNNQYPVAKIVGTDYNTAKTYITQSVLDGATGNGDDISLRNHLNNLRNIPGALVTTYTYKPLVGMTSATDVNGRTTYYIYDDLNRLQLIKDQDGNIIKKICYNYAGQPGDCTVNTDPNWTATGNLRCETNGSGNTGYQEREEVDQNPNSATSNQTRWVINGYNTTACPLPAPPCTISMNYGFTNATNSIYNNGTSVQFYMAFYSNTVMNPGISYYVGNITGSCRPSSTRTINYSSSSQNWTITIEPSGVMYWYLNYGSTPVPAYSTIGTSTLTYNL